MVSGKSGSIPAGSAQSQYGQSVHGSDDDELRANSKETSANEGTREKRLRAAYKNGVSLAACRFCVCESRLAGSHIARDI